MTRGIESNGNGIFLCGKDNNYVIKTGLFVSKYYIEFVLLLQIDGIYGKNAFVLYKIDEIYDEFITLELCPYTCFCSLLSFFSMVYECEKRPYEISNLSKKQGLYAKI